MALKTNFTDDILSESMNGKRQYNVAENSNGTKSLEDVTDYQSVGSTFSAKDMNETNAAVNQAYDDMGDEFNPKVDYAVGDYTIHNNKVWKFTTAHPAGAWDESHVKATKILSEAHELTENLTFPDGTGFYPDEQDGQKGYNTSPNRGADTFFPFSADLNIIAGLGYNKELVIPKNIKKALAIFDGHGQTSDVAPWTITITSSKDQSKEVVHFNKVPNTYRVLYTYPFNFYSAVITNLHKDDTIKASASISYLIIY